MNTVFQTRRGVTLVGGGAVDPWLLRLALSHAPDLAAADGGADRVLALGHTPRAVIGDLDSISATARAALPTGALHRITDQATTDFDKALRALAAPFVIALGFTGARLDHTLAAFNTLARHPGRGCILIAGGDLCFLAPSRLRLALAPGTRLSLFPFSAVRARSTGLEWPLAGIDFAPWGMTGISNRVTAPVAEMVIERGRMLVILPLDTLGTAISALARPGAPHDAPSPARGG